MVRCRYFFLNKILEIFFFQSVLFLYFHLKFYIFQSFSKNFVNCKSTLTYVKNKNIKGIGHKGIEFLSQTLIFLSLYLCILMSKTLDISNYQSFRSNYDSLKYQRFTPSDCKDIAFLNQNLWQKLSSFENTQNTQIV